MPHKPAPRLKSFDYLGIQRYFLTICTRDRRETFLDVTAVNEAIAQLRRTSTAEGFAIIAYCFMPDHLHLLCEGTCPSSDFREFVRLYKQRSSFAWKQRTALGLWQRGYFDRVLRADEDTVEIGRASCRERV